MASPEGIFGIPHGVLSSADEKVAFAIGVAALAVTLLYDGELDVAPASRAALLGVVVALAGSFVAPAAVTNEWHIPVLVVLVVAAGAVVAHWRG